VLFRSVPKPDRRIGALERSLYRRFPTLQKLMRWAIYWKLEVRVLGFLHPKLMDAVARQARRYIRRQVKDKRLRRQLTPDYTIGCKRVLISDDYYPALERPNVELITEPISEVRAHSVVTADGREREVDAIIYGTGFRVQEFVPRGMFVGRGGVDLADAWSARVQAYKGTTVAGFPNLFILLGPNTGLGHTSMVLMIESQVAYVMDALREMRSNGWAAVEVDPGAVGDYNRDLQARHAGAVWQSGCRSWYLDAKGRNTALWPGFTFRFRKATRRFDAECYRVEPFSEQPAEADAASDLAPSPRRVRVS